MTTILGQQNDNCIENCKMPRQLLPVVHSNQFGIKIKGQLKQNRSMVTL